MIKSKNINTGQYADNIIKILVNSFFDNIIDEETLYSGLVKFLIQSIDVITPAPNPSPTSKIKFQLEISNAEKISDIKFSEDSFTYKLLSEYTKRFEFIKYTKFIFKSPLHKLMRIEELLSLDPEEI